MKIKEEIAAQKDLFYEDLNKIIVIRSVKGSPKKRHLWRRTEKSLGRNAETGRALWFSNWDCQ